MSTVDTFTTADAAWSLVHHFLGNRLSAINLITEAKSDGWSKDVEDNKVMLISSLKKIVERLFVLGNVEESAKINQIRQMVEEGDLTDLEIVQAIHDKSKELDSKGKAFTEQVEKLRQTREAR